MLAIQTPRAAAGTPITQYPARAALTATKANPSPSARKSSPSACRWESIRGKATIRPAEGRSSVGRALVSKTRCRRFESCRPCWCTLIDSAHHLRHAGRTRGRLRGVDAAAPAGSHASFARSRKWATLTMGAPRDQPPGRLLCRRPWSTDVLWERPHSPGAPILIPRVAGPRTGRWVRKRLPRPRGRPGSGVRRDAAEARCHS
jgi:hypothetical protein